MRLIETCTSLLDYHHKNYQSINKNNQNRIISSLTSDNDWNIVAQNYTTQQKIAQEVNSVHRTDPSRIEGNRIGQHFKATSH